MRLRRPITTIIAFAAAGFIFAACGRLNPFSDEIVIARVGESKLYESDVKSLFTPGMNAQDSLKMLESYVDVWVKKQLKIQEAERLFKKKNSDIERLVTDYRNALLSNELDQYYVSAKLDTLYTDEAIVAYYNSHKSDFVMDRTILKGRMVKVGEKERQIKKLKELIAGTGDRLQDFTDLCNKNKFEFREFGAWTDMDELQNVLPVNRPEVDKLCQNKGLTEIKDGNDIYLVYITDCLRPGDTAPMERVTDVIKRILLNQRRQDIIRTYEDSMYRAALESREVEIKYGLNPRR